jgi:hypothetical protein
MAYSEVVRLSGFELLRYSRPIVRGGVAGRGFLLAPRKDPGGTFTSYSSPAFWRTPLRVRSDGIGHVHRPSGVPPTAAISLHRRELALGAKKGALLQREQFPAPTVLTWSDWQAGRTYHEAVCLGFRLTMALFVSCYFAATFTPLRPFASMAFCTTPVCFASSTSVASAACAAAERPFGSAAAV